MTDKTPDSDTRASADPSTGDAKDASRKNQLPRQFANRPPETLQVAATIGAAPGGAQAVQLTFAIPRPSGLSLGPDPYLVDLLKWLTLLAPALSRGAAVSLEREIEEGGHLQDHIANAIEIYRSAVPRASAPHKPVTWRDLEDAAARDKCLKCSSDDRVHVVVFGNGAVAPFCWTCLTTWQPKSGAGGVSAVETAIARELVVAIVQIAARLELALRLTEPIELKIPGEEQLQAAGADLVRRMSGGLTQ